MEKGQKVLPLRESWLGPTMVSAYDGQSIYVGQQEKLRLGHYLGGGIAGVVYEAIEKSSFIKTASRQVAVKILNPVGYKLVSPLTLARCEVVKAGNIWQSGRIMVEHIWWVVHPNQRELVACIKDGQGSIKEMNLEMCANLWSLEEEKEDDPLEEDDAANNASNNSIINTNSSSSPNDRTNSWTIPRIPKKWKTFLRNRKSIYREIVNMHRLSGNTANGQVGPGHINVLKLYDVLEYIQASKTTIFLVLELAAGGELFDRIKTESGVEEKGAKVYFQQLLSGVQYCHQLGIVHRDLKPENLLLSEHDVLKIADFGLSAHFIAAFSASSDEVCPTQNNNNSNGINIGEDIVVLNNPSQFRRLKSVVGSPHYVAPEVLQKCHSGYDGRKADMWSLGVILYGLLVGSLPFGKDLQLCPRYLQFCEWVRSLPTDMYSLKLVPDMLYYQMNDETQNDIESLTLLYDMDCQYIGNSVDDSVRQYRGCAIDHYNGGSISSQFKKMSKNLSFPTWFFHSKLSPQAVYLLTSLLHPDPMKRVSCDDTVKCDWMATAAAL